MYEWSVASKYPIDGIIGRTAALFLDNLYRELLDLAHNYECKKEKSRYVHQNMQGKGWYRFITYLKVQSKYVF